MSGITAQGSGPITQTTQSAQPAQIEVSEADSNRQLGLDTLPLDASHIPAAVILVDGADSSAQFELHGLRLDTAAPPPGMLIEGADDAQTLSVLEAGLDMAKLTLSNMGTSPTSLTSSIEPTATPLGAGIVSSTHTDLAAFTQPLPNPNLFTAAPTSVLVMMTLMGLVLFAAAYLLWRRWGLPHTSGNPIPEDSRPSPETPAPIVVNLTYNDRCVSSHDHSVTSQDQSITMQDQRLTFNDQRDPGGPQSAPPSQTEMPLIGMLYAAPLIYEATNDEGERQRVPIETLDFARERASLFGCFDEAKRAVQVQTLDGTVAHLQKLLTLGCRVLHYSGHGAPEFLALEGPHGLTQALSVVRLGEILQASIATGQLQLAFVSACYSEAAGRAFVAAGVPHVVAITLEQPVYDVAAMCFAEQFYLALLVGRTVRQAFDSALQRVRNNPELGYWQTADSESTKFLLLPDAETADHDRVIFGDVATGAWQPPAALPSCSVPVNSRRMVGRADDQQRILALLASQRLFTLTGMSGMGKTTLACEVARYLHARQAFADGVFFYELRGALALDDLRRQIIQDIGGDLDVGPDTMDDAGLVRLLRDRHILLVLDYCDDALNQFGKTFRDFLSKLLNASPHLKLLITARQPVGAVKGVPEQTWVVKPLDALAAVELFMDRAPEPQRADLAETYATQNRRERLAKGALFQFLAGHPGAICMAAGMLSELSLNALKAQVARRKEAALFDRHVPLEERDGYTSLTVSLELSVAQLRRCMSAALPLLGLLGLLPGKVSATDLDGLWPSEDGANPWPPLMDELVRRNLVDRDAAAAAAACYSLLPFVASYAEKGLTEAQQVDFAERVAQHLAIMALN